MAKHMSSIRSRYTNCSSSEFKAFYRWMFNYIKGDDKKKSIPVEMAVQMWSIVLQPKKYPLLANWLEFIQKTEECSAITADVWSLLLDFIIETKADLSDFDPDGCWPVMIDEFVDWLADSKT